MQGSSPTPHIFTPVCIEAQHVAQTTYPEPRGVRLVDHHRHLAVGLLGSPETNVLGEQNRGHSEHHQESGRPPRPHCQSNAERGQGKRPAEETRIEVVWPDHQPERDRHPRHGEGDRHHLPAGLAPVGSQQHQGSQGKGRHPGKEDRHHLPAGWHR